jgi:hypothetical protein
VESSAGPSSLVEAVTDKSTDAEDPTVTVDAVSPLMDMIRVFMNAEGGIDTRNTEFMKQNAKDIRNHIEKFTELNKKLRR